MDYIKRAMGKDIGPGGWKCRGCGPKPKDRPAARRVARARIKVATRARADAAMEMV